MAIEYRTIDEVTRKQVWEERIRELERAAFRQEVDLAVTTAERASAPAGERAALTARITELTDALSDKERRHAALTAAFDQLGFGG